MKNAAGLAVIGLLVLALATHVLILALVAIPALTIAGAFGRWAFVPAHHLPRNRVRDLRLRLHFRLHPGRGHASAFELWLRWGRLPAYMESRRTRPGLSRWQRIRHPHMHSLYVGRAQYRQAARVPVQEHGAIIGPPRAYKTALLSRVIMAAPGSVVCTSSKPDLFSLTSGLRARHGPVYVFNPQGIGGIPSNVRWSPLDGCLEPATAIRRADAFSQAASTTGAEDATFWAGKASDGMRGIFAAAAMTNSDMRQVGRWAGSDEVSDAVAILAGAGHDDWATQLAELTGPAEKTAATVRMVMSRAVAFLNDPALASATLPAPGQAFGVDQFLLSGGTLYMLAHGNGDDAALAPLFAALASEIEFRATQLGSRMPGGRLDPPLLMALDEVTQVCPVPLPQWLADAGGQGVQIWTAFHGFAQLRVRWKDSGAQTVIDTSNMRVFMPGLADTATLEAASKLCGRVSYRQHEQDQSWQFTEVMSESMIRELPAGFALVIRNNLAPVIVRLARGWEHHGYKRLARRGEHIAPVIAPAMLAASPAVPLAPVIPGALVLTPAPPPEPEAVINGNGHHKTGEHPWSAR